jgi:hypothetical protein
MQLCIAHPPVEVLECKQGACYTILVKAVSPIGAAVPGSVNAVDLRMASLRGDAVRMKNRVSVGNSPDDGFRPNVPAAIQGDE